MHGWDIFPTDGLPKDNKPFQVVDRLSGWSPWVIGRPAGATTLLRRFVKQVVNPFVKNFDLYRQCAKIDAVAASAPITPRRGRADHGGFGRANECRRNIWNRRRLSSRVSSSLLRACGITICELRTGTI